VRHLRHSADEEGEGYFASVSDLMVGILFVFLLMLTVFALNYRQAEQEQLIARSEFERLKVELLQQKHETEQRQREEADRRRHEAEVEQQRNQQLRGLLKDALDRLEQDIQLHEQARQNLLANLDQQLRDRGVQVVVDQHSGVLRLSGDLLFATGSAALSSDAQRTVHVIADVLQLTLPCYAEEKATANCPSGAVPVLETVLIEGHTDHRPITGTAHYRDNDQLSTERALAVFAEMRRDQPGLDAIRNPDGLQLIGETGYGDRRPLPDALGTTDDDFRKNRRIDIRFVLTSRTSDELKRLREHIQEAIGTP
jgi:chemotaxis protein MotB